MGGTTPGLVVLDGVRKQAEHGKEASKQYSFMASSSVPAMVEFLLDDGLQALR